MGNANIIFKRHVQKKRKVGMRAGMTRAKIADAATKLWLSGEPTTSAFQQSLRPCLSQQ